MNIVQLMQVAPALHDLAWLKEARQAAIQLELAALPPYLCAMWSVKSGDGEVYDLMPSGEGTYGPTFRLIV
jgi:hypothetical protein